MNHLDEEGFLTSDEILLHKYKLEGCCIGGGDCQEFGKVHQHIYYLLEEQVS